MSDDPGAAQPAVTTLWQSETAIVVDKPSGMLVHNSGFAGPKERSLRQVVGTALGRRVFPVHRLDRGTSGCVLFAREREFVADWQAALAEPSAAKVYLALVRGRPREEGYVVERPVPDANGTPQDAVSHVLRVAVSDVLRASLVAVRIDTGRHHQIRRHMAHLRHPIVNDARHGNSRFNREFRADLAALGGPETFTRLGLHAALLRVVEHEALDARAPLGGPLAAAVAALFPDGVDGAVDAALSALATR